MDARDVIVKPIVTEASTELMDAGKYTFRVHLKASKTQIRDAVEEIFNVDVTSVNTARMRGKMRRMGKTQGRRPDWKKAIVTVKEGQSIQVFEGL